MRQSIPVASLQAKSTTPSAPHVRPGRRCSGAGSGRLQPDARKGTARVGECGGGGGGNGVAAQSDSDMLF